jgi:diaminopimelate decarboxylase
VRYAQKANGNLAVLDLLRRAGALVDAVSAGEVYRALAAGFRPEGDPPPIVYTADIFDRDALEAVAEHGLAVNCGSPDMVEQYAELRVRRPALSRDHAARGTRASATAGSRKTNTGGEHSSTVWHERFPPACGAPSAPGCASPGSTSTSALARTWSTSPRGVAAARFARSVGADVRVLSAGGGLPTRYREEDPEVDVDAYFRIWDAERRALARELGHAVRLEIEPGRYVVAEAGVLLAEIRAVKRMGANTFYLLDAGFNNLPRPILYGAYHPMAVVPASGEGRERALRDVVVGGPLCESGDIFTQDASGVVQSECLPEARVGEHLAIECAGAYAFAMSSNYNARPLAAEVLVVRGKPHLVRARQGLEDLIRGESIPVV